jgi:DNA polymerase (family 10)
MLIMQDRFYVANQLRAIGQLLALTGDNPFKAQAYERGAHALENLAEDLDTLVRGHRLTAISGIGSALAAVIEEVYQTGESFLLQQLREQLPPGAVELSRLPGLSLKKIAALHDQLAIESVDALKTACQEGLLRNVKGFGKKSEAKLLADIEQLAQPSDRFLLHHALSAAEHLLAHLRAAPELTDAAVAGALRRREETVRQLTIVAGTDQPKMIMDRFLCFPALRTTIELTERECLAQLADGMKVRLIIAEPECYIATLHRATGSRAHLHGLAQLAARTENAVREDAAAGDSPENAASGEPGETAIYHRLGLPYIAPELRENDGELEAAAAGQLPDLLRLEDIQGMTHCHTDYSDGANSIEEMALAAAAAGMKYLTITDHSPTAFYARGVQIDRLSAQWEEIARVQERVPIKLLRGTESDITESGALDYPDNILERFDVIIASIHARNKMDSAQMTDRLLKVLQLPLFKIWGHPLGRLIQSRAPIECRVEEILDAVAASRAAIEINGDPHRLDLEPRWIRRARERGIKFIVSTDAHSTRGMGNLHFAVAMARRGWLQASDVLNTLDAAGFSEAVRP